MRSDLDAYEKYLREIHQEILMIETGRFTLIFPLVLTVMGGCLSFIGLLMVFLLMTLGDEPGPFLEFGIGSLALGPILVYVAYKTVGSMLPLILISSGSGLFFIGFTIFIVAIATGDAPPPIPHMAIGSMGIGLFLAYFGYRKLAKKLAESENQLLRY